VVSPDPVAAPDTVAAPDPVAAHAPGVPPGPGAPCPGEWLVSPGAIGGMELPHRTVLELSPEAAWRSESAPVLPVEGGEDGSVRPAGADALDAGRCGGAGGLLVVGGGAVSAEGVGGSGWTVLTDVGRRAALAWAVGRLRSTGARVALRVAHAGPCAPCGPAVDAAPSWHVDALSARRIAALVGEFARAGTVARELGFDAVELDASAGTLPNRFTAPATNRRTDAWGGDPERRRLFPLTVVRAVRDAVGTEFPLLVRISGADLVADGTPAEDVAELAGEIVRAGADALAVRTGWSERAAAGAGVRALVPDAAGAGAVTHAVRVKQALAEDGLGRVPVIACLGGPPACAGCERRAADGAGGVCPAAGAGWAPSAAQAVPAASGRGDPVRNDGESREAAAGGSPAEAVGQALARRAIDFVSWPARSGGCDGCGG